MNRLGIALFFFSLSTWASAANDNAYFKLHQATGFFEQYVSERCPSGKKEAQNLLSSLEDSKLNVDLMANIRQLKNLISRSQAPSVTELETFRLSIHELQKKLNLHHETNWHDELVTQCKLH